MIRKSIIALLGTVAMAALAPTAASAQSGFSIPLGSRSGYENSGYGYDGYRTDGRHVRRHERLEDRHDNVHENLGDEHEEAHEEGLTRREHRGLHRDLNDRHEDADYRIERQHRRQDLRDSW